jgi:hypothetical protein
MESSSLKALARQQLLERASSKRSGVTSGNGIPTQVDSSTVFVTGLALTCTDEDLKGCFFKYVQPKDLDQLIVSSNLPFLGPGFALVGLGSREAAGRAVADSESLDGGLFIGGERITAVPSSSELRNTAASDNPSARGDQHSATITRMTTPAAGAASNGNASAAAAAAASMTDATAFAPAAATSDASGVAATYDAAAGAAVSAAVATATPVPPLLAPTATLAQLAPKHVRVLW